MMENKQKVESMAYLVFLSYVIMITFNVLANAIPINQQTTGQISDSYFNLFAPAGFTFAIWGLIYIWLFGFVFYHWRWQKTKKQAKALLRVQQLFIVSSLLNAVWIVAWHNHIIWLSLLIMIGMLLCLIQIAKTIRTMRLHQKERWFLQMPFSVYLGWISIATIANITTWLVAINWNRFSISATTWTILVLIIGFIITSIYTIRFRDLAYGLVGLWAYIGIFVRHSASDGLAGMYPTIGIVTMILLGFYGIVVVYLLLKTPQVKKEDE